MGISRKKAIVLDECVACGCCEKSCPLGAIRVHKGLYAVVDERKCVGCGRCEKDCPAGVIEIVSKEAVS